MNLETLNSNDIPHFDTQRYVPCIFSLKCVLPEQSSDEPSVFDNIKFSMPIQWFLDNFTHNNNIPVTFDKQSCYHESTVLFNLNSKDISTDCVNFVSNNVQNYQFSLQLISHDDTDSSSYYLQYLNKEQEFFDKYYPKNEYPIENEITGGILVKNIPFVSNPVTYFSQHSTRLHELAQLMELQLDTLSDTNMDLLSNVQLVNENNGKQNNEMSDDNDLIDIKSDINDGENDQTGDGVESEDLGTDSDYVYEQSNEYTLSKKDVFQSEDMTVQLDKWDQIKDKNTILDRNKGNNDVNSVSIDSNSEDSDNNTRKIRFADQLTVTQNHPTCHSPEPSLTTYSDSDNESEDGSPSSVFSRKYNRALSQREIERKRKLKYSRSSTIQLSIGDSFSNSFNTTYCGHGQLCVELPLDLPLPILYSEDDSTVVNQGGDGGEELIRALHRTIETKPVFLQTILLHNMKKIYQAYPELTLPLSVITLALADPQYMQRIGVSPELDLCVNIVKYITHILCVLGACIYPIIYSGLYPHAEQLKLSNVASYFTQDTAVNTYFNTSQFDASRNSDSSSSTSSEIIGNNEGNRENNDENENLGVKSPYISLSTISTLITLRKQYKKNQTSSQKKSPNSKSNSDSKKNNETKGIRRVCKYYFNLANWASCLRIAVDYDARYIEDLSGFLSSYTGSETPGNDKTTEFVTGLSSDSEDVYEREIIDPFHMDSQDSDSEVTIDDWRSLIKSKNKGKTKDKKKQKNKNKKISFAPIPLPFPDESTNDCDSNYDCDENGDIEKCEYDSHSSEDGEGANGSDRVNLHSDSDLSTSSSISSTSSPPTRPSLSSFFIPPPPTDSPSHSPSSSPSSSSPSSISNSSSLFSLPPPPTDDNDEDQSISSNQYLPTHSSTVNHSESTENDEDNMDFDDFEGFDFNSGFESSLTPAVQEDKSEVNHKENQVEITPQTEEDSGHSELDTDFAFDDDFGEFPPNFTETDLSSNVTSTSTSTFTNEFSSPKGDISSEMTQSASLVDIDTNTPDLDTTLTENLHVHYLVEAASNEHYTSPHASLSVSMSANGWEEDGWGENSLDYEDDSDDVNLGVIVDVDGDGIAVVQISFQDISSISTSSGITSISTGMRGKSSVMYSCLSPITLHHSEHSEHSDISDISDSGGFNEFEGSTLGTVRNLHHEIDNQILDSEDNLEDGFDVPFDTPFEDSFEDSFEGSFSGVDVSNSSQHSESILSVKDSPSESKKDTVECVNDDEDCVSFTITFNPLPLVDVDDTDTESKYTQNQDNSQRKYTENQDNIQSLYTDKEDISENLRNISENGDNTSQHTPLSNNDDDVIVTLDFNPIFEEETDSITEEEKTFDDNTPTLHFSISFSSSSSMEPTETSSHTECDISASVTTSTSSSPDIFDSLSSSPNNYEHDVSDSDKIEDDVFNQSETSNQLDTVDSLDLTFNFISVNIDVLVNTNNEDGLTGDILKEDHLTGNILNGDILKEDHLKKDELNGEDWSEDWGSESFPADEVDFTSSNTTTTINTINTNNTNNTNNPNNTINTGAKGENNGDWGNTGDVDDGDGDGDNWGKGNDNDWGNNDNDNWGGDGEDWGQEDWNDDFDSSSSSPNSTPIPTSTTTTTTSTTTSATVSGPSSNNLNTGVTRDNGDRLLCPASEQIPPPYYVSPLLFPSHIYAENNPVNNTHSHSISDVNTNTCSLMDRLVNVLSDTTFQYTPFTLYSQPFYSPVNTLNSYTNNVAKPSPSTFPSRPRNTLYNHYLYGNLSTSPSTSSNSSTSTASATSATSQRSQSTQSTLPLPQSDPNVSIESSISRGSEIGSDTQSEGTYKTMSLNDFCDDTPSRTSRSPVSSLSTSLSFSTATAFSVSPSHFKPDIKQSNSSTHSSTGGNQNHSENHSDTDDFGCDFDSEENHHLPTQNDNYTHSQNTSNISTTNTSNNTTSLDDSTEFDAEFDDVQFDEDNETLDSKFEDVQSNTISNTSNTSQLHSDHSISQDTTASNTLEKTLENDTFEAEFDTDFEPQQDIDSSPSPNSSLHTDLHTDNTVNHTDTNSMDTNNINLENVDKKLDELSEDCEDCEDCEDESSNSSSSGKTKESTNEDEDFEFDTSFDAFETAPTEIHTNLDSTTEDSTLNTETSSPNSNHLETKSSSDVFGLDEGMFAFDTMFTADASSTVFPDFANPIDSVDTVNHESNEPITTEPYTTSLIGLDSIDMFNSMFDNNTNTTNPVNNSTSTLTSTSISTSTSDFSLTLNTSTSDFSLTPNTSQNTPEDQDDDDCVFDPYSSEFTTESTENLDSPDTINNQANNHSSESNVNVDIIDKDGHLLLTDVTSLTPVLMKLHDDDSLEAVQPVQTSHFSVETSNVNSDFNSDFNSTFSSENNTIKNEINSVKNNPTENPDFSSKISTEASEKEVFEEEEDGEWGDNVDWSDDDDPPTDVTSNSGVVHEDNWNNNNNNNIQDNWGNNEENNWNDTNHNQDDWGTNNEDNNWGDDNNNEDNWGNNNKNEEDNWGNDNNDEDWGDEFETANTDNTTDTIAITHTNQNIQDTNINQNPTETETETLNAEETANVEDTINNVNNEDMVNMMGDTVNILEDNSEVADHSLFADLFPQTPSETIEPFDAFASYSYTASTSEQPSIVSHSDSTENSTENSTESSTENSTDNSTENESGVNSSILEPVSNDFTTANEHLDDPTANEHLDHLEDFNDFGFDDFEGVTDTPTDTHTHTYNEDNEESQENQDIVLSLGNFASPDNFAESSTHNNTSSNNSNSSESPTHTGDITGDIDSEIAGEFTGEIADDGVDWAWDEPSSEDPSQNTTTYSEDPSQNTPTTPSNSVSTISPQSPSQSHLNTGEIDLTTNTLFDSNFSNTQSPVKPLETTQNIAEISENVGNTQESLITDDFTDDFTDFDSAVDFDTADVDFEGCNFEDHEATPPASSENTKTERVYDAILFDGDVSDLFTPTPTPTPTPPFSTSLPSHSHSNISQNTPNQSSSPSLLLSQYPSPSSERLAAYNALINPQHRETKEAAAVAQQIVTSSMKKLAKDIKNW